MPSAGFDPAIPTVELLQTCILDGTASGTDETVFLLCEILSNMD
jgi:hypothetical protein